MYLVACDPGSKFCAFAVFKDSKFTSYCKVKSDFKNIRKFFSSYKENFKFCIEDQYLNLNARTLIKLVTVRTMVLTLAKVEGAVETEVIPPQRWQTVILGVKIKSKREQRKRLSLLLAEKIAGRKIGDSDIADAICIGEYVNRTEKFNSF